MHAFAESRLAVDAQRRSYRSGMQAINRHLRMRQPLSQLLGEQNIGQLRLGITLYYTKAPGQIDILKMDFPRFIRARGYIDYSALRRLLQQLQQRCRQ